MGKRESIPLGETEETWESVRYGSDRYRKTSPKAPSRERFSTSDLMATRR